MAYKMGQHPGHFFATFRRSEYAMHIGANKRNGFVNVARYDPLRFGIVLE
jgi:hypothetical protein